MWEVIDVTMREAGVKPDVTSFFLYIKALVTEGNYALANRIVKDEMMPLGIDSDSGNQGDLIDRTLNQFTETDYSKMRTFKLIKLREEGGTLATNAAWKLFNNLLENDVANIQQFNTMMTFCLDTEQMLEMMEVTMKNAGMFFNILKIVEKISVNIVVLILYYRV